MYEKTTKEVTVRVRPEYLADRSEPANGQYVWAYHIEIENGGDRTVQLLTRHWRITDAHRRTQEVRGDGVVGEQPVLRPGERFAYTSGCPLTTPSGFMVGSYQMVTPDGDRIEVAIPAFSLDSPHVARSVH